MNTLCNRSAHRRIRLMSFLVTVALCAAAAVDAGTRYVSPLGGHVPPFTNGWAGAATNIQHAVDAAAPGDVVLVSNGVYAAGQRVAPGQGLLNRVVITNAITVRGLNGPEQTVIRGAAGAGGGNGAGAVRCVFMSAGTLDGLTISNGHTSSDFYSEDRLGGGVRFSTFCVITNCIVAGNRAVDGGGLHGQGTVIDSALIANHAELWGGGAVIEENGMAWRCVISGNTATNAGGVFGGSAYAIARECIISNNHAAGNGGGVYSMGMPLESCTITCNTSGDAGGGVYGYGGSLNKCVVTGNVAGNKGGGVWCWGNYLTNCLIASGNAASYGGGMYIEGGCVACNCTVSSNCAAIQGGGVYFYYAGGFVNTIIYHNFTGQAGTNWHSTTNAFTPFFLMGCCTTPTNGLPLYNGCVSEAPLFDAPGSDYHLLEGSPCIDAGVFLPWMALATDLDGNPRYQGGGVDIGCYESVPEPLPWNVLGMLAVCAAPRTIKRRTT